METRRRSSSCEGGRPSLGRFQLGLAYHLVRPLSCPTTRCLTRPPLRSARTPLRFASGAGRQARGAPSASIRECLATLEGHQGPGKTIRDEPRQSSGGTGGPVLAGGAVLSEPIPLASGAPA